MKKDILHTNKSSGFKLPKNYFNGLEDKILAEAKLSNIKKPVFKTPSNYFESLEETVFNKISKEKETTKVFSIFTKRNLIYISSVAAAILLMFNLSIFENELDFDTLDKTALENYIINEDISSLDIASLLTNEELTEVNFIDYDLPEEHIENYILDHIDIENMMLE